MICSHVVSVCSLLQLAATTVQPLGTAVKCAVIGHRLGTTGWSVGKYSNF